MLLQTQGADYRGTTGLLVPASEGHPSKPVTYAELQATNSQLIAQVNALSSQLAAIAAQVQLLLSQEGLLRFDETTTQASTEHVFTHNFGVEPASITIYSMDGEVINDSVLIQVLQPGVSIQVLAEEAVRCRVIMRP